MLNRNQESGITFSNTNNVRFDPKYIHTMKDDLTSSSSSPKKNSEPSAKTSFFSEKKEVAPAPTNSSASPFLAASSPADADISTPKSLPTQAHDKTALTHIPPTETAKTEPEKNKSSFNLGKFIIIFVSLLIIITLFVGGYYFWKTRETETLPTPSQTNEPSMENITQEQELEEQITITPAFEKYSFDKPNYLSINIEEDNSEKIKNIIIETAKEIEKATTKSPFEFIITDSNNNPLAFPIFATVSDLGLSSELISALEENFSFYIYNDNNNIRTGLVIATKNESDIKSLLRANESSLTSSLSFLFLDKSPDQETVDTTFQDSSFSNVPTRYVNLNAQENLSIDYAVFENKLAIGTSKNTMQTIITKVNQEKTAIGN